MKAGYLMNACELIQILSENDLLCEVKGRVPDDILNVTNHSGQVVHGTLFAAVSGSACDGHRFLTEAVQAGAVAVIYSDSAAVIPPTVCAIRVSNSYAAYGIACACAEGFPAQKLTLCAVTGTNGKTTTAFWMRHLLTQAFHQKVGLLSTVVYDDGGGIISADRTTPAAGAVQAAFSAMVRNGCAYAVMEQSSHGLDQHRTGNACFSAAVFTNLTGDHLDYHGTLERYYAAKRRLFTELLKGTAVINTDDPWGMNLAVECRALGRPVIGFGMNNSDWHFEILESTLCGTRFQIQTPKETVEFDSPHIGEHNVYNLCGALGAVYSLGVPLWELSVILKNAPLPAVPGRMESFRLTNGATAFVDYAHTDDALLRAMAALRQVCRGRLIVVFGCGGDRDRTKRPRMGEAVSLHADFAFITSDNPRSENPLEIINEIKTGISAPYAGRIYVEPDRLTAIQKAAAMAKAGDAVLIAGKGHETYQETAGMKTHFDDREAVKNL